MNWVDRTPAGANPIPRAFHAMAYDVARRQLVLFGGGVPLGANRQDTWEYSATSPHPRSAAHSVLFTIPPAAVSGTLSATYVGAGKGDLCGVSTPGVALRLWSFATSS